MKWVHDDKGEILRRPARVGLPMARPPGDLPCKGCAKISTGAEPHPANAVNPTPASRAIYAHYLECRAVNWQVSEAADPLVRRAAAIIRGIEEGVEQGQAHALAVMLGSFKRKT